MLHQYMPAIRADILSMQAVHAGELKWFERFDKWRIVQAHGIVSVVVPGITEPEVGKKKVVNREEVTGVRYGLLVELTPSGYAFFTPGEGGMLKYEECVFENASNQDPPGIVGQETFRGGWAYKNIPALEESPGWIIEQIKRVDQGYLAYDGDEDIEEVTMINAVNNYWTYENIEYPIHWVDVDPGPPPESFCHYTWAPWPQYGGEEADYHDDRHLFYYVQTGGKTLAWWPPEFNQYVEKYQYWNEEGGCCRVIEGYAEWDAAFYSGVAAACSGICFPGTIWAAKITYDDSERIWGIIWGNYTYTQRDRCINKFPFTDYEVKMYETSTGSAQWHLSYSGVYVKDRWQELFIQISTQYGNVYKEIEAANYYMREEIIEADEFVAEAYPRDPLTERQLTLMEGNEDEYDYEYDPYTDLWLVREGRGTTGLGMIAVNAGGTIHDIRMEEYREEYVYADFNYKYKYTGYCYDYGIFTKENTGIKDEEVDADSIDPIYVYALLLYNTSGDRSDRKVVYGIVIDGEHYKTDEFDYSGTKIIIPEITEPGYSGLTKVRAGIRKDTIMIKSEAEYG